MYIYIYIYTVFKIKDKHHSTFLTTISPFWLVGYTSGARKGESTKKETVQGEREWGQKS